MKSKWIWGRGRASAKEQRLEREWLMVGERVGKSGYK
jgi:hypothetical protein